LSQAEALAAEELSANIPRLWHHSPPFSTDHKQIVRCLIDRVILHIQDKSENATVTVRWQGGFESRHGLVRSVARHNSLADYGRMRDCIDRLWRSGRSTRAIAETLNDEGFPTPRAGKKFTRHTVRKLLDSWGLTEPKRPQVSAERSTLGAKEWWLLDLSSKLSIDRSTLARWCRRGWVHARQLPGQRRWWIIWADEDECSRLRQLYEHGRGWPHHGGSPYPSELTTPK
jgi:hypothetical protein